MECAKSRLSVREVLPCNEGLEKNLIDELNVPSFIAKMLINRGISSVEDAKKFINPELSDLYDPFLMKGIKEGVRRITKAIEHGQSICVYGDYDTDGISGASLLVLTLQKLGAKVKGHIPHRLKEGYGLKKETIKKLSEEGVTLIITVDCGITAFEEIGFAHSLGMDVIVTDHHRALAMLPPAEVIINPMQMDCPYPFKELAGVGVVFKLGQALTGLKNEELLRPESHLDLVTLGTIADLVPLRSENRILVKYGLRNFANTDKVGLKALSEVAGADLNKIDVNHIGYRFAPRINAGGRMGDAKKGFNLLLSRNFTEAKVIALMLDEDNRTRQKVQREVFGQAHSLASSIDIEKEGIIILSSREWHQGVIGIVASRLAEEYNCPAVLISVEDGIGSGSSRSIRGIDIMEVLRNGADLFSSHGGHEYAAGFTIKEEKIDELKKRIKNAISKISRDKYSHSRFIVEAELDPGEIPAEVFENWMNIFSPFGKGNPLPIFLSKNMVLIDSPQVTGSRNLRLILKGRNQSVEAIGSGMGSLTKKLEKGDYIDIIFSPRLNNSRVGLDNRVGLDDNNFQISIEDIKIQ